MALNIGTATNKKLLELFNMMKLGSLVLRPSFQRKLVWNHQHKENFIETILLGLPFPEIYLSDGDINLETQTSQTLVVDGQQRLSTIYQYITDSNEFKYNKIKRFKDLSPKEKTDFYDYNLVVRDLGRLDKERIIEIFKRINSVQYALNAMEIHNALYEGEFITCAKEILNTSKFGAIEIFSENEYSRMRDIEFILNIMATVEEGGYFTGNNEVETYILKNDDLYKNKDEMKSNFVLCIDLIIKMELAVDSLWLRKTSLFSIISELLFFKKKYGLFPDIKSLKDKLLILEKEILENKNFQTDNEQSNKYALYYKYIFSGTASRTARIVRGNLIKETLELLK